MSSTRTHTHRGGLAPDKFLSDEQLRTLRRHAIAIVRRTRCHRARTDKLIIDILALAGLRASELCALTLRDCPHVHGKLQLIVRNGKGNVSRAPGISPALGARIRRYAQRYRAGCDPMAPLIAGCNGRPVAYHVVWRKVCRLMEGAGIRPHRQQPDRHRRDMACHALRHSAATNLLGKSNNNIKLIQDWLGHKDLQTTSGYLHVTEAEVRVQTAKMR